MDVTPAATIEEYRALPQRGSVTTVKPRVLLRHLELLGEIEQVVRIPLPPSELGSIPVFDAMMLASLVRLARPSRILEFGTYLGYSTRVLLENTRSDCKVVSVDLPHGSIAGIASLKVSEMELHENALSNDEYLREVQFREGPRYLRHCETSISSRVDLVSADSRALMSEELTSRAGGEFDFVFIDGGHDLETIRSDTRLAIRSSVRQALIVWHDYKSKIHEEVTEYLDELAFQIPIHAVAGTLIAYSFLGEDPLLANQNSSASIESRFFPT
jgi:predicted O-methyltransferase YrrM